MDSSVEKEFSALGGLFQHIMTDLKNSAPVWDDFLFKAGKFHSQLKSTILASTSFLDAFQKIADMATSTRGATKEIGSALTRLCLRQRSVEAKLQTFSNALLENLLNPLQDKLEEWKKTSNNLDKEHSKEFKRAKQELKKKSSDTLKLQKKVRKVGVIDIRRTLDYALQDVTDKYLLLEEIEKQSVRKALIEERSHFCMLVGYLQPVLESELSMLHEVSHIQEVIDTLSKLTGDPHLLPSTSEQVIADAKKSENTWSFHATPPDSPGSLGSRKSSVCSISSMNSSSSGSLRSQSSRKLSHSQVQTLGRKHLSSVASQDSGFTSQDTLFYNNMPSPPDASQLSTFQDPALSTFSTPSSPVPDNLNQWPNHHTDSGSPDKEPGSILNKYQRPHTISSAYEKNNHNRPALSVHTFLPLDQSPDYNRDTYGTVGTFKSFGNKFKDRNCTSQPGTPVYSRPSLPERYDRALKSRPSIPEKSASVKAKHDRLYNEPSRCLPDFNRTLSDQVILHPIYANSAELAGKKSLSDEIYVSRSDCRSEVQNRKEFAAVLNEGLLMQSKWMRAEKSFSESESSSPPYHRLSRSNGGSSETLPRSRGSLCGEPIPEWPVDPLSLPNNSYVLAYPGQQRRPMSIAGISSGFLLPRKASTLQRMGSAAGPKPPAPVRRSSSITSSSSQNRICDVANGHAPSGAGEVRYSPSLREFQRSRSTLSSPQAPSSALSERSNSSVSLNRDTSPGGENSIVTDVSDSRARLIQDLNVAIQNQKAPKKSTGSKGKVPVEAPVVPPRNTSKNNTSEQQKTNGSATAEEDLMYGQVSKRERSSHTFSARLMDVQRQQRLVDAQRLQKPRLKECLSQSDLFHCSNEWDRPFDGRKGSDLPEKQEILLKKSFVAALNAKLAEQNHQNDDRPRIASWLINDKNFRSSRRAMSTQAACRESLMDQIKRGTRLRRVKSNDRSSPRLV